MPYDITIKDPLEGTTRYAVTTLDAARKNAYNAVTQRWASVEHPSPEQLRIQVGAMNAAQALGRDGGTVGPLPDGTVIDVERIRGGYQTLRELSDLGSGSAGFSDDEVIDAYNRQQAGLPVTGLEDVDTPVLMLIVQSDQAAIDELPGEYTAVLPTTDVLRLLSAAQLELKRRPMLRLHSLPAGHPDMS